MKTDCDAKTSEIETKHSTTSHYNKFTGEIVNAKIKERDQLVNVTFMGLKIILIQIRRQPNEQKKQN